MVESYKPSEDIPMESVGKTIGLKDLYTVGQGSPVKVVMGIATSRGKLILFDSPRCKSRACRAVLNVKQTSAIRAFMEEHKYD